MHFICYSLVKFPSVTPYVYIMSVFKAFVPVLKSLGKHFETTSFSDLGYEKMKLKQPNSGVQMNEQRR